MNFQQLKCVLAVADTKSFTKAADICCITQPALSNSINLLEEELGGKIFARTTRSVSVTEFGEHLLGTIRDTIDSRSRLMLSAADFLARDETTIRIGLSPLISSDYVELLLKRANEEGRGLNLVLTEMNKADIEPALESGIIDYGLAPTPVSGNSELLSSFIYSEPLLFVSNQENQNTSPGLKISDVADQKFLLTPDSCGLSSATRNLFRDHGKDINEYEGHALGYHILEKWARLGIGVTMLPVSKIDNLNYAQTITTERNESVLISFHACWKKSQESQVNFQTMQNVIGVVAS